MSKPHLTIIGGAVHCFKTKEAGQAWTRSYGLSTRRKSRRINDKLSGPKTFGDWVRGQRKIAAMRVKPNQSLKQAIFNAFKPES